MESNFTEMFVPLSETRLDEIANDLADEFSHLMTEVSWCAYNECLFNRLSRVIENPTFELELDSDLDLEEAVAPQHIQVYVDLAAIWQGKTISTVAKSHRRQTKIAPKLVERLATSPKRMSFRLSKKNSNLIISI